MIAQNAVVERSQIKQQVVPAEPYQVIPVEPALDPAIPEVESLRETPLMVPSVDHIGQLPVEPYQPTPIEGADFQFELLPDRTPNERPVERQFVEESLQELLQMLSRVGGTQAHAASRQDVPPSKEMPMELIAYFLEVELRKTARTGGDSVIVEPFLVLGTGYKKIIKARIQFIDDVYGEEQEGQLSVCWNWDTLLEPKPK